MSKTSKKRGGEARAGNPFSRKTFIIATEGDKTEPQYFNALSEQHSTTRVKCINSSGHDSAPGQVLKRMEKYLEENGLGPNDEAWVVVDKNHWSEQQLAPLAAWARRRDNPHLALSNPKFEYWLLLHFEESGGVGSSRECDERLRRRLPHYDKKIDMRQITRERIMAAIRRARQRDRPPCEDWPRAPGGTTAYRLAEKLLLDD